MGDGKSISALEIGRHFDPHFTVKRNLCFYAFDYMQTVNRLSATQDYWGQSWAVFDEPNLDLGQLEFQRLVARTAVKFTQASRFKGTNGLLALPATRLMNSGVIEVAQCRIIILGEGRNWRYGKVEEIKPNIYSSSPRFFFPRMGWLKIHRAPKSDIAEYEAYRKTFHGDYFNEDKIAEIKATEEQKKHKKTPEEYAVFVVEHLKDPTVFPDQRGFLNEKGELSYSKIQAGPKGEWDLSTGTASRVKNNVAAKTGVS